MIFYDKEEILKRLQKLYDNGTIFKAFIDNQEIFPYTIKLKLLNQKLIIQHFSTLLNETEKLKNIKLEINYRNFKFKNIGSQNLPISITCRTLEEFLDFIGKKEEYERYKICYLSYTKEFPKLKELFEDKPKIVLENLQNSDKILQITIFFYNNPMPDIYIRELPMAGVDTKFVEKNKKVIDQFLKTVLHKNQYKQEISTLSKNGFEKKYGLKYKLPLVRFRILDKTLYINGLSDISINIKEFENLSFTCRKVFLVENEITALSFPNIKESIVVFAGGYGVGTFKNIDWFKDKEIYYWGDIDMDGFAILSQARSYFPQTKSIFMDSKTVEEFKELAVQSDEKIYKKLDNLTQNEELAYDRLFEDYYGRNFRLEQERLPVLSRILVE